MTDTDRKRRVLAAVTAGADATAVEDLPRRLCAYGVDRCRLSGCAVTLMSDGEYRGVLAAAGRRGQAIAELQFSYGEGPCLDAYLRGEAVLADDLLVEGLARWPAFAREALDRGVRAVFSFPLGVGAVRFGALDLTRDHPGGLTDEEEADARTIAELTTDAVLQLQARNDGVHPAELLDLAGESAGRIRVHQATGMVSARLELSPTDALARLRAHALAEGQSLYAVADAVVRRTLHLEP